MSDIKSKLKTYLTTIANAIREKKGTTEPINASNFASEILSIQGGGSLNVAYSLTPPTDTSKIWLQCAELSGVEVQNYLGECAVSNVVNYGTISNPTTFSSFFGGYYSSCYIGNNQIAIVGYNHIRIYDLTSKSYIADYTISVGTDYNYTNVIYKDNVLYFGRTNYLYSFDLTTQTLTRLGDITSKYIKYIFFNSDSEIYILCCPSSGSTYDYLYKYDIANVETTLIKRYSTYYLYQTVDKTYGYSIVKTNNFIYCFNCYNSSGYYWKYNLSSENFEAFTTLKDYVVSLGVNYFQGSNAVYDGERYIYVIGGGYSGISYNNIIKYDTINDTFEILEQKLLKGKYFYLVELINNRVYMFGGKESGTDYGRQNQIDYFDLSYPLTQNNAIITTNTINTDNNLPLINTEKLKLNSNIASAYKGNAENLAEKVNAYYWNGSKWVGINCADYREE